MLDPFLLLLLLSLSGTLVEDSLFVGGRYQRTDKPQLNGKASKALDVANQADKEYQRALQRANEKQQRFYSHEMPSLLEIFQHFEEERLQFLKEMFERVAELFAEFPPLLENAAEVCAFLSLLFPQRTD